jgi:hypothetical protein
MWIVTCVLILLSTSKLLGIHFFFQLIIVYVQILFINILISNIACVDFAVSIHISTNGCNLDLDLKVFYAKRFAPTGVMTVPQ